jgi:hypothetical protein
VADCTDCIAGKFSGTASLTACTNCGAGKYALWGASVCTDCAAGKYGKAVVSSYDVTGQDSVADCTDCVAGKFSGTASLTACTNCGAGKYAHWSASVCTDCAAGKQGKAVVSSYDVTGQDSVADCSNCVAGKFSGTAGASCTYCANGKWAAAGSSVCTYCAAGKFKATAGSAAADCIDCESGKYSATSGASMCTNCAQGTWSVYGAIACTKCPPGKTNDATWASSIYNSAEKCSTECTAGTYADGTGCLNCEQGTWAAPISGACTECPAGKTNAATWAAADYDSADDCTPQSLPPTAPPPSPSPPTAPPPSPSPAPPPSPSPPRTSDWGNQEHAHCVQPYTWNELIQGYKDCAMVYKTGGLGQLMEVDGYETWQCIRDHYCATDPQDPWFCFVYHETNKVFTPWGHNSHLKLVNTFPCPCAPT